MREGLSYIHVTSIFEDSRGIMWIGTEGGGLNRYMPSGFKVYRNHPADSTSFPSNIVNSIIEDKTGILWMATAKGLVRFNPYDGSSKIIQTQNFNLGWTRDLEVIDDDTLLISTGNGVFLYHISSNQFSELKAPQHTNPKFTKGYNDFGRITHDRNNRIWIANRLGLYLADIQNRTLQLFEKKDEIPITEIYHAQNGQIYVALWPGGVLQFVPETGEYLPFLPQVNPPHSTIAASFTEWTDNAGNDWLVIGFASAFILRNQKTGEYKSYSYNPDNPNSYSLNLVGVITKDRQNRLWLGADNGLHIIDPVMQNFSVFNLYKEAQMERPQDFGVPSNLFKEDADYIFPVWFARGLFSADKNWKIKKINTDNLFPKTANVNSDRINQYYRDPKGIQWFATDSGLVKKDKNKIKLFTVPGATNYENLEFVIGSMIPANNARLWLRSRVSGIMEFDTENDKFIRHFKKGEMGLNENNFSMHFVDSQQVLWVGNGEEVFYLDENQNKFIPVIFKNTQAEIVKIIYPRRMAESLDQQFLWITAENGIAKLNRHTKSGILYDEKNGLAENVTFKPLIDSTGIFWFSSLNGINRFDEKTGRFSFFSYESGLPNLFDNWGIFDFDLDGNIVLGQNGVITRFNPYQFRLNSHVGKVVLLDIKAGGQTIPALNRVILKAGTNSLLVHFDINNYSAPNLHRYFYRFSDQPEWTEVEKGSVFFGRMSYGDYTLHLKGINNEGIETPEEKLQITINPFWYETILFRVLVLLCLLAIASALIHYRINSIKKEADLKQKLSETEMKALRSQMNPHFVFNCLNSIELYTAQNNSEAAGYYLSKFSRLIRLVLDNSKANSITLEQELETLQLYMEMEKMRFKDKLNFNIHVDENVDISYIEVPPMLIQPYVENAIWHGIMHKRVGGTISLNVELNEDKHVLIVTVTDDGIGREKAAELKSKSAVKHKSFGMKITDDRMQILSRMYQINTQVQIVDLFDNLGNATGTKVIVQIPI